MRSPSDGSDEVESPLNEQPEQSAPPLAGRIHYLIGGMLPAKNLDWVRHDLTGRGWRNRQARRSVLLMLPFAIAFAFLPGQASLRVSIPLALLVVATAMGYATSDSFRNRRLAQYGIERPKVHEEDEDDDLDVESDEDD